LNIFPKGRKTCDSVSAFNLEAQPAQFESEVNRICFPETLLLFIQISLSDKEVLSTFLVSKNS